MTDPIPSSVILAGLPAVIRVAAMVLTMPLLSGRVVPVRVKTAVIVALSLVVVPQALNQPVPSPWPGPGAAGLVLVQEGLLGALMGFSLSVMLAAAQLAGSLLEALCGFSVTTFGGTSEGGEQGGPLARLFWWTTAAVFVAAGGVGQVVDGLLGSFHTIPAGTAAAGQPLVDFLTQAVGQAFSFGLSAALPAIAALVVASMVLGMAQRNLPQLGGMQIGLNVKAVCGMVVTSVVLLSTPWLIHQGFELTLQQLQDCLPQWTGAG
jgi:flagellar biosynthetic protein FliR